MSNYKIAIVNSSSFGKIFSEHIEKLKKIGKVSFFTVDSNISGKKLAELLSGFNIIISSVTPFFDEEFFDHKDELMLISRHGIGYNNINIESARKHDTIVSIVPAIVERNAVAENNVANLLALMRKTCQAFDAVKDDNWKKRSSFVGNSLFNKIVGVIGVGNIGSCVVEILKNGFKCDVLAYDPYKDDIYLKSYGAKKVELSELLTNSDVICLCANLTDENYHMISYEQVDMMKKGVYISNTARGALLDEEAIIYGLKSQKISGLATDVLEFEPGRVSHPYLSFSNVILTPHTSAYTLECLKEMGNKCVSDVENIVNGLLPERSIQITSKFIKK